MLPRSETLTELIEPTLFALRSPTGALTSPLVAQARASRLRARAALHDAGRDVDALSFELGVASTFTELLAVTEQRCVLNDALRTVKSIPQGLETLHQIAVINRSGTEANQGELAERIGVDRGNFNRRIRKFVDQGLIESQRRGQSVLYDLTPLGMDVLTQLKPGWRAVNPFTQADVTTEVEALLVAEEEFGRLIANISSGLERMPPERGSAPTTGSRRLLHAGRFLAEVVKVQGRNLQAFHPGKEQEFSIGFYDPSSPSAQLEKLVINLSDQYGVYSGR